MAKSLIGKADSTIVSAAYKAAMANVPKDNLESLKITREAYKSTLDTVEGIFKSMQEKHEADNAELEGYLTDLKDEAASGTHKSVITDQVTDALSSFRQEYKKIPKGPKGEKQRLDWRGRVNKYTNGLKNESENLSLVSEYFLNKGVNINATGEKGGLEFFNAIMKYRKGEEGHGVTRSSDTDGNIFYTYNGQKMSMSEMMKLVVPKHIESQGAALKVEEKLTTQGLKGVNELDRDLIYDTISPTLNSKDALHDFVYTKRGKEGRSIAQEIQSLDGPYTNEIFSALNERGLFKELDIGGEEGLDVTDFQGQNAGKYKAVADHILKGNNFDMSKKMVLDIYSSTVGQKALDRGINAYNIKQEALNKKIIEERKDKETLRLGWSYGQNTTGFDPEHPDKSKRITYRDQSAAELVVKRNSLLPANKEEIAGNHYRYVFNKDKNTWQAFYDNKYVKDVTGSQIASWEGLLSPYDVNQGKTRAMFNVGTKTESLMEEQKDLAPETPGGIGLGAINTSDINQVRVNLLNILAPQFKTDFTINPVYEMITSVKDKGMVPRKVSNKIKIIGPGGFEKIYDIGPNATKEIAAQMTNDFSDYVKQDPFLIQ